MGCSLLRLWIVGLLAIVLFGASACVSDRAADSSRDEVPVATCAVCLHEGDMGCVRVPIDERAVRLDYHGETVYFCSEDCRRRFLEHPERYEIPAPPVAPVSR